MRFLNSRVVMMMALLVIGCESGKVKPPAPSKKTPEAVTSEDVLSSAIFQMRPENFGINANMEKPVSLLNSWRYKQAEKNESVNETAPANVPTAWVVSEDEKARLEQPKYDIQDAVHIRDAKFHHAIAGYVSDRGHNELERVGAVIDFVCRNVGFWKDDEVELPLRPFLIMEFGRGSANDRAAVCAEILRQLRVDSLILRAKSDLKQTTDKWVFGVVVERKVYLYDLRIGLPLSGGDVANPNLPATLDQISAHPELLELMSTKEPYRMTPDDFHDATVSVISDSNFWCERMRLLEQGLPPSEACVLYDPLLDKDGKNGLVNRIAAAGGWAVDHLNLWQFPKRQNERLRQMTQQEVEEFKRLQTSLAVPIPFKSTEDGKVQIEEPKRLFLIYRMDQLLGKFSEATQRYLSIRHLEVEPNPPQIEQVNRMAAEDALYWTSLCKTELEDHTGAVDLLKDYVKKYDRKGKWFFSARPLLAHCLLKLGKLDEAISTLERSSSEDPYQLANAVRLKRWTAQRSK